MSSKSSIHKIIQTKLSVHKLAVNKLFVHSLFEHMLFNGNFLVKMSCKSGGRELILVCNMSQPLLYLPVILHWQRSCLC